ncbi:MAG TPA: methionyl-tRNA formyltransferase [Pseudolabrys sp.]|nr:methionyl-tRNA formyltransferase [Pseudolabrys sp.]
MPLRLVFMGTPDFAVPTLIELAARGHEIAAVYTRAPKPAGRGMDVQVTPVEREARRLKLPVFTPKTLRDTDAALTFRSHQADVAVVVAYGLILPKPVLDTPKLGCFNVHASLLPRWRGAAPINRAVMAGDAESGVTIMSMDEGLDTGAMAMIEPMPIQSDMTAGDLHDVLAPLGADLMSRALAAAERGTLALTPQPADGVIYAEKISKSETRIDWAKPWRQVHDHIRGLSPFPGAWFEHEGKRVKALLSRVEDGEGAPGGVLDDSLLIACGEGAVRLLRAQREGRAAQDGDAFLRGFPLKSGARLT